MRPPLTSAPPCTWQRSVPAAILSWCEPSGPSPPTCIAWPTGSSNAGSRRWRWSRPASTGSRSTRSSISVASRWWSSTPATPSTSRAARPMSATPLGCSACTNTGCCARASDPPARIATLRSYLRQRERLLDQAAAHIQHMQKALTEMNLQLHHVVADVTGVTGLRILRALVAGERDPDTLAAYSDPRCKAPAETLRAAMVGNYREEHVFALAQALELYDIYQAKVAACDQRIEAVLERLKAANPPPAATLPPARPRRRQANEPGFAVREALHAILGADPTQIDGIGPSLALTLVGECGTDLSAWPSAKHFTSWLSLAPHNKIS